MSPARPVSAKVIKPTTAFKPPRCLLFIDSEAYREPNGDTEVQRFAMAVGSFVVLDSHLSVVQKQTARFTDPADLWRWVVGKANKYHSILVFSHNLGYDFLITAGLNHLPACGYELSMVMINNQYLMLEYGKDKNRIRLIDSVALLQGSIAQLGRVVGLEKLEYPGQADPADEMCWEYCARDVEILEKAILSYLRFLHQNRLGKFRPTIAGQAFSAYRHRFMSTKLVAPRDEDWVKAERAAYYGGRCECWRLGTFNSTVYYKLDVNSMYPYVMREFEHPTCPVFAINSPSLVKLQQLVDNYWLLGLVYLDTPEPIYPYRADSKLLFPVGRFWTWLCGAELAEAIKRGHIKKAAKVFVYEKGRPFVDYVDYFYSLRVGYKKDGNAVYDFMCKLFLNSLYGKFAERGRETKLIATGLPSKFEIQTLARIDSDTRDYLIQIGDRVFEIIHTDPAENAFPAVAASITAAARLTLYKLAEAAGLDNVYYMDTDSLFVNATGRERLKAYIDPSRLGYLKDEGSTTHLELRGLKDYTFGDVNKCKGLSKNFEIDENGTLWRWVWLRFKGALRQGISDRVILERRPYTRRSPYDKGRPQDDGRVEPLELCEPCPPEPLAAF